MDVLLMGEYPPLVESELRRFDITFERCDEASFSDLVKSTRAILLGENASLPEAFYDEFKQVEVLVSLLEGARNIDLLKATRAGLPVLAPSRGIAPSVADYLFARLLELVRLREDSLKVELKGKVLGILGWQTLSEEVCQRAKAFDMEIIVADERLSLGRASAYEANIVDQAKLFAHSDFLCILKPYDEKHTGMVSKDLLKLLKPEASVFLFTDPRMTVFDDLVRGVAWGEFSYLVVDLPHHYQKEYELLQSMPNVLSSLGEAGQTKEAEIGIAKEMVKDLFKTLQGRACESALNIPQIGLRNQKDMKSYAKFFTYIGELSSARFGTLPEKIELLLEGTWQKMDEMPLAHHFLEGLAKGVKEKEVNHINAKLWAEEKGIALSFMHGDLNVAECLAVRLTLKGESYEIVGRVFGSEWQILGWDDYQFIASPTKHLLILPHANCPGMIGKVGNLIGERKINIGGMVLGHSPSDSNRAMMWIKLDSHPSGDLLEELQEMPDIYEAIYVYSDCVKGMESDVRHQTY